MEVSGGVGIYIRDTNKSSSLHHIDPHNNSKFLLKAFSNGRRSYVAEIAPKTSWICQISILEGNLDDVSDGEKSDIAEYVEKMRISNYSRLAILGHKQLYGPLFTVCRQTSEEVHSTLYAQNLFIFADIIAWRRFILLRYCRQLRLFHHLAFLDIKLVRERIAGSNFNLSIDIIRSLENLQTLQLVVEYHHDIQRVVRASDTLKDILLSQILCWSVLSLKDVKVCLVNSTQNGGVNQSDESFVASYIRSKILDRDGESQYRTRRETQDALFQHMFELDLKSIAMVGVQDVWQMNLDEVEARLYEVLGERSLC